MFQRSRHEDRRFERRRPARRQGLGGAARPARPGGDHPRLRAARVDRRQRLRDDGHRGRRRDQGHLQRLLLALRPPGAPVAGDEAPGRRRPGHRGRDGQRGVLRARPGPDPDRLRGRRGRRRHGRRRRPADAQLGVEADGRRVLLQRRTGHLAALDGRAGRGLRRSAPAATPGVFTAPAKAGGISSRDDFLKGIAVGAGLVVLGVVVGSLFGRRR